MSDLEPVTFDSTGAPIYRHQLPLEETTGRRSAMDEIKHELTRDQLGLARCVCGWSPPPMTFVGYGPQRVQEHVDDSTRGTQR